MSLTALGPGLTTQYGPFKTHKSETPKFRKTPWKGGGVSGGGTLHAGHANWFNLMNPTVIRAVPYPLKPSQYATLVGPPQPSTYFRKSNMGRQKSEGLVSGRNSINQGVQNPGQGNQGGRQVQGEPAVQNEEGQEDQDDDDFEDAMSITDSAQGDNSVRFHQPSEFGNQQQYVTQQPIVSGPGVAANDWPVIPTSSLEHAENYDNLVDLYNLPSVVELGLRGRLREKDRQLAQMELLQGAPSSQVGHLRQEAQNHIDILNSDINRLTDVINNERALFTSQSTLSEREKLESDQRINTLQSQISELTAQLEAQPTTTPNSAASSSTDLAQQALHNFSSGPVAFTSGESVVTNRKRKPTVDYIGPPLKKQTLSKKENKSAKKLTKSKSIEEEAAALRKKALNSVIINRTAKVLRGHAKTSEIRNRTAKVLRAQAKTSQIRNRTVKVLRGHAKTSQVKARINSYTNFRKTTGRDDVD